MANYHFWMFLCKKGAQKFLILFTGNNHLPTSAIAGIRLDLKARKPILSVLFYTELWLFVRLLNYLGK